MKKSLSCFAALGLSASLALPLYAQSNANEPPSPPVTSSKPATAADGKEDTQIMFRARHELDDALQTLSKSEDGFNGHRDKAVQAVVTALEEVNAGLVEHVNKGKIKPKAHSGGYEE